MQIVFLLSLRKRFGGGDYSIFKFSEALSKRGHTVLVFYLGNKNLLSKKQEPSFKIFKKLNVELDFKGRGLINIFIDFVYDQLFLNRYLRKNKDQIDYIFGYQREIALKANKLGAKYGIKTATFTFETPDWLIEKWPAWGVIYNNDRKLKKSWANYKKTLNASNLIIANSEISQSETWKWMGRKPDLVLYPGINPEEISSSNVDKKKQIIYVGRLEENKNINEIIEALAMLRLDINLVICGRGSMESRLQRQSASLGVNVDFKGDVTDEVKWTEIEKSLFMIFPSSFEGFGMPPMEALSMKVPCLCSNIPIFKEVYGNYVEYFEEHDVSGMAEKIKTLTSDYSYLKARGESGQTYVLSNFSWDKSAQKLENCLLRHSESI